MRNKALLFFLIFTSSLFIISLKPTICKASPLQVWVPDAYPSIQDAINNVANGTIIHVRAKIYYENIRLNKSVTLIGENAEITIIDGNYLTNVINVVYIGTAGAEIRGFTLRNAGPYLISSGWSGISIFFSSNVKIYDCIIKNCTYGIEIKNSNTIDVGYNIIRNNSIGLYMSLTTASKVYANTISYNLVGISSVSSTNQISFYRNNLIQNSNTQASDMSSLDKWNNGAEGNFWDDYVGDDTNGDGIGDTGVLPYLGLDSYPLVQPWSLKRTFNLVVDTEIYEVTTFSNTTIASLIFDAAKKQISFNTTAPSLTSGFCNITIPNNLMWGDFNVSTKTQQLVFTKTENTTHYFLHFYIDFSSTQNIKITATYAVPEFTSLILILILLQVVLFTSILKKFRIF